MDSIRETDMRLQQQQAAAAQLYAGYPYGGYGMAAYAMPQMAATGGDPYAQVCSRVNLALAVSHSQSFFSITKNKVF